MRTHADVWGGKDSLWERKENSKKTKTIIACFTCLQLHVTLLYICVCEYAHIRMTDHDHRTYEAIRTYLHKYVLVWVRARVAGKKKMYIQIRMNTCVCIYT